MKTAKTAALLLAFFISGPALSAQVRINKIDWQVSKVQGQKKLPFEAISEIILESYQKFPHKLRAVVTAQNTSAKPAGGLVLRCALSLHIVRLGDAADTGFWAVPFRVEELRISQIRPAGFYEAKLIHSRLNEQLKKLKNTGFWADALKLAVMLDPRQGDDPAAIIRESVISIKKP
ncbi:MAG: hypothetical protein HY796_06315 [Elusimicrobia bacterium]|nr:hypothetical protein [Elusimicrobiota bacterium]